MGRYLQHRISVDIHHIIKVLIILTCQHITCPIGIRERVQKRLQTPLHKLHERFLSSVLLRTAQNRVLQNMRYPGRVGGRCTERYSEHLVVVVVLDREELRARLLVAVGGAAGAVFLHRALLEYLVRRVGGGGALFFEGG